jgi:hypothetical protein
MRFSKLIAKSVRMMDLEDAKAYVGGPTLLELMEEHGWIKAAIRRHRMVRFDCKVLDAACDRLSAGEFPGES